MNASVTLSVGTVNAILSKNGKISVNNSKAADLLNGASKRAVVGAALTSKGAVRANARGAILANIITLDSLLCSSQIDGSQWGDLLALLVGEFGTAIFSRATMSGKSGCTVYLKNVIKNAEVAFSKAETAKAQVRPMAIIERAQRALDDVVRLIDAANVAMMQTTETTETTE